MQNAPFSINFDESTVNGTTQLDINVGHLTEEFLVGRKMFGSIELTEGTEADEVTGKILEKLDEERIDPALLVSVTTDGANVMLGVLGGVQAILRKQFPTLPKWGGCPGHDLCNVLKSETKALDPKFILLSSAALANTRCTRSTSLSGLRSGSE